MCFSTVCWSAAGSCGYSGLAPPLRYRGTTGLTRSGLAKSGAYLGRVQGLDRVSTWGRFTDCRSSSGFDRAVELRAVVDPVLETSLPCRRSRMERRRRVAGVRVLVSGSAFAGSMYPQAWRRPRSPRRYVGRHCDIITAASVPRRISTFGQQNELPSSRPRASTAHALASRPGGCSSMPCANDALSWATMTRIGARQACAPPPPHVADDMKMRHALGHARRSGSAPYSTRSGVMWTFHATRSGGWPTRRCIDVLGTEWE